MEEWQSSRFRIYYFDYFWKSAITNSKTIDFFFMFCFFFFKGGHIQMWRIVTLDTETPATRRREKREGKRTVLENTLPTTITSQYQLELPNKTENSWRWLSWPTYSVVPYPKRHDTAITPPQNKKKNKLYNARNITAARLRPVENQ